ncbi:hypothetical protein N0V90_007884 [Kalmusia sp. IMI 367209]|nr:hypothetical protein N0V90_007884 [Kalmusia sp. IMI 367209]
MTRKSLSYLSVFLPLVGKFAFAQDVPFSPCPLLGPRFPIARNLSASTVIQSGFKNLTDALDDYVASLNGTFGPTSSSTSFSIALFSTDSSNSTRPFIYEYHHTSDTLANATAGTTKVDGDSVYRVGDLTTLFTTWLFLTEAGEQHWEDPVSKWVPELVEATQNLDRFSAVNWNEVTLGDLAAHLGGIGHFASSYADPRVASLLEGFSNSTSRSPCQLGSSLCDRKEFLAYFGKHSSVFAPGTTPIFSNAGYIILAFALESITGRSYNELLKSSILEPLNMSSTSYLQPPDINNTVIPANLTSAQWSSANPIEGPYNGLYSNVHDISTGLRAILSSSLISHATTHRWLKPVSHTSNLVNSIGRPWEIYSLTATPISPVIPVYQVRGNVGLYSSHIGLVPDYDVGFVILAADSEVNPDLNAYADIISIAMLPALEQNAIVSASKAFAGTYVSASNTSIVIAQAEDSSPGLSLTSFKSSHKDVRAVYAELNDISPENLSFRLYPTNTAEEKEKGKKMAFRASFQDVTELADAGTPTCDTWRYIDQLQVNGVGLDEFIFEMEGDQAVGVTVPALNATFVKQARA